MGAQQNTLLAIALVLTTLSWIPSSFSARFIARALYSPPITTWGISGTWEMCPGSSCVLGMELKCEDNQHGGRDDTGLNGIRLYCGYTNGTQSGSITGIGIEGEFGSWRGRRNCPGSFANGFELRSEVPQGLGDDTAANDFRLLCAKGEVYGEGVTYWGDWTDPQICGGGEFICGMRTQVEPPQGSWSRFIHDDTSLNNVDVYCCSGCG